MSSKRKWVTEEIAGVKFGYWKGTEIKKVYRYDLKRWVTLKNFQKALSRRVGSGLARVYTELKKHAKERKKEAQKLLRKRKKELKEELEKAGYTDEEIKAILRRMNKYIIAITQRKVKLEEYGRVRILRNKVYLYDKKKWVTKAEFRRMIKLKKYWSQIKTLSELAGLSIKEIRHIYANRRLYEEFIEVIERELDIDLEGY